MRADTCLVESIFKQRYCDWEGSRLTSLTIVGTILYEVLRKKKDLRYKSHFMTL